MEIQLVNIPVGYRVRLFDTSGFPVNVNETARITVGNNILTSFKSQSFSYNSKGRNIILLFDGTNNVIQLKKFIFRQITNI